MGIGVLALVWAIEGLGAAANSGLRIAVAANFRAPFAVLGADFTKAAGIELAPVFGASGLLATQIRQGAPFDAFLSADLARPQALVDDGLAAGPVRRYARGLVALWTPGRQAGPAALGLGRIALPNIPSSRPTVKRRWSACKRCNFGARSKTAWCSAPT